MKYRVLYSSSVLYEDAILKLNKIVEDYMSKGFKPHGSMQFVHSDGCYEMAQAMIKED